MAEPHLKGHIMRRTGLLIAGFLLASGAGLALASPASAAARTDSYRPHHSQCHHGQHYGHWYGNDWYGHHHHHGGGLHFGIGIGG
jgi:hypothetical protein